MNENQTLEMQVKSTANEALKSINKLTNNILKLGNNVQKVSIKVNSNGEIVNKTITSIDKKSNNLIKTLYKLDKNGSLKQATINMKNLGLATKKTSSFFGKLGNAISFAGLYYGVKRISSMFLSWMGEATDRTEQLNLFNVVFKNIEKNGIKTFSSLGKESLKFQNKLNESFGTNLTDTLKYQALFQSMGENASIPEKYAGIMSETMTKFTYDLASLYNKSETDVAEALRAGVYAGQTKPLRSYGIDVTQSTMAPLLERLGINDRSVSELSQGEKEILRYIAALEQAKVAMGDYADTVESPANQMKVFKNLLVEAKVALTSLFINSFSKILPYANAFLMVVKEVSKSIATLFGIELSDYNSGISSNEDSYEDLSDSIDGATDSLKELKRQTLGFDQINNINENKDNNGNGTLVSGGIDQRLLDAIKGYDNGMDKVKMKATQIRDSIMEWLGFTKSINSETGEIKFTLNDTNSNMGKIINSLKDIVIYGKDAIKNVFKIIKNDFDNGSFGKLIVNMFESVANLFKYISKNKNVQNIIAKVVESLLLLKTVKTILTPLSNLWKSFSNNIKTSANFISSFAKQLKGTNNYILDSKNNLIEYNEKLENHNNVILNSDKSINKWKTSLNNAKTALVGIGASVVGLYAVHDAIKSIVNEGPNLVNVMQTITGSLTTIGGFASIGSIFGPVGTAIGAVAGVIATLVTTLIGYDEATENSKIKSNELTSSIDDMKKTYEEMANARHDSINESVSEISHYQQLWNELENIVDSNGKIKKGYEERANVITSLLSDALGIEIKIIDGQIKKYGELEKSIKNVITQKRAQILLEEYEKDYAKAKAKITEAEQLYGKAITDNKNKTIAYNSVLQKFADILGISKEEVLEVAKGHEHNLFTIEKYETALGDAGYFWNEFEDEVLNANEVLKESTTNLQNQQKVFEGYSNTISIYEKAYGMALQNNWEALDTFLTYESEVYGKSNEETKKYYENKIVANETALKQLENNRKNYTDEEYNSEKNRLNNLISLTKEKLLEINMINIKSIDDLTPEVIKRWGELAQSSEEEFMNKFKLLPYHIQEDVINKMYDKGYKLSQELQEGINALKPQVKVNIDELGAKVSARNVGKKIAEELSSGINSKKIKFQFSDTGFSTQSSMSFTSTITGYANGGFPEDGWFRASQGEIMGKFDNGKSVVANNMQITEGIKNAVMQGMAEVMSRYGNQSNVIDLHVHSDEGVIVDKINQTTKQTGICPINIPII